MNFKLKNNLYLSGLKFGTRQAIRNKLTMNNPKYDDAVKMNRYILNPVFKASATSRFYTYRQEQIAV